MPKSYAFKKTVYKNNNYCLPYMQEQQGYSPYMQEQPSYAPYMQDQPGCVPYVQEQPGYAPYMQGHPGCAPYMQEQPSYAPYVQEQPSYASYMQGETGYACYLQEQTGYAPYIQHAYYQQYGFFMEQTSYQDCYMQQENYQEANNISIAEEKKKLGNDQYKAQNYQAALTLYSDAISLCPDSAAYYGNRSACYMMLSNYTYALNDARTAVRLDPTFEKAYMRIAKCCVALGDIVGAEQAIKKVQELTSNVLAVKQEKEALKQLRTLEASIDRSYTSKAYRDVVYFLDNALKLAPACLRYRLLKAECLVFLGRSDEALDIAVGIMKLDATSADAIYIRGLCLYYTDALEKSVVHFERALQLDPDHQKAKDMRTKSKALKDMKENGNSLFKCSRFREALKMYTDALNIDQLNKNINSKLLYNRALVHTRIGQLKDAIADCTRALNLNSQYLKALLLRARCHSDLEKYKEAVADYEAALQQQKTPEVKKLLRDAKAALKRSERKDYYKILGIPRNANDDEIKRAYRKKAMVHHPDRHVNGSPEEREEEEKKFKEIGEAYAILSDQAKRLRYDSGKDFDEYEREADIDPNFIFRQYFQFPGGTGGGQPFHFEF